jgi:hypothetical protein
MYSAMMNEQLCCAGFEDTEVPPKLFVLMGNFQSDTDADASSSFAAVRENFNALAALLRTFRLFRVTKLEHRTGILCISCRLQLLLCTNGGWCALSQTPTSLPA